MWRMCSRCSMPSSFSSASSAAPTSSRYCSRIMYNGCNSGCLLSPHTPRCAAQYCCRYVGNCYVQFLKGTVVARTLVFDTIYTMSIDASQVRGATVLGGCFIGDESIVAPAALLCLQYATPHALLNGTCRAGLECRCHCYSLRVHAGELPL